VVVDERDVVGDERDVVVSKTIQSKIRVKLIQKLRFFSVNIMSSAQNNKKLMMTQCFIHFNAVAKRRIMMFVND
jgi:hypothetical protein